MQNGPRGAGEGPLDARAHFPAHPTRPACFYDIRVQAAKKCLIFRAFLHICGKGPNLLRFFEVLPLYLAGNAVKSGSSLISFKEGERNGNCRESKKSKPSLPVSSPAQLAEKHELSQKSANAILEDIIGLITKHLKKGARIRLNGLGILVVRKRGPRIGRNPATGEAIKIKCVWA